MTTSSEPSPPLTPKALMAKSPLRSPRPSILADGFLFAGGAAIALLVFWVLYSFLAPNHSPDRTSSPFFALPIRPQKHHASTCDDMRHDPPSPTFYDDRSLTYTIDHPIKNWDEKRREWLRHHPSFAAADGRERILLVSGSQPGPCKNPVGDHILLRFFKNKVDYCRIHGVDIFYNTALLHPEMFTFWAKIPLVRAAMVAHPESEWIWWVDSDAAFTDMEFELPLSRYQDHNLVVHGWPHLIYEDKSWTSLNAGVFLIRNCQWSLDFMEVWASMGPQSPDYDRWGQTQKSEFKDKVFPESDDQSALVYLLLKEKEKWGNKIYLESEYYFEGYWVEIVGRMEEMARRYVEMEKGAPELRRRRAEKVTEAYGKQRERYLEGLGSGRDGWRRPFITHFTGCQPCSGDHNRMYSGENCWEGMQRALNFADDQVLRGFGFHHRDLLNSSVRSLPFDFPAST